MSDDVVFCAYCGAEISVRQLAEKKHVSYSRVRESLAHCDREHDVLRRMREGFYAEMSRAGNKQRHEALLKSNKANPRRRKHDTETHQPAGLDHHYKSDEPELDSHADG